MLTYPQVILSTVYSIYYNEAIHKLFLPYLKRRNSYIIKFKFLVWHFLNEISDYCCNR